LWLCGVGCERCCGRGMFDSWTVGESRDAKTCLDLLETPVRRRIFRAVAMCSIRAYVKTKKSRPDPNWKRWWRGWGFACI